MPPSGSVSRSPSAGHRPGISWMAASSAGVSSSSGSATCRGWRSAQSIACAASSSLSSAMTRLAGGSSMYCFHSATSDSCSSSPMSSGLRPVLASLFMASSLPDAPPFMPDLPAFTRVPLLPVMVDRCAHPVQSAIHYLALSNRAARTPAWMRGALPAVAPHGGRDHGGAFARERGYLDWPKPQGLRPVRGEIEVVAALVPPDSLVSMVGRPVELDADAILGVPIVSVVCAAADLAACLPLPPGESVRSLDIAGVPVF